MTHYLKCRSVLLIAATAVVGAGCSGDDHQQKEWSCVLPEGADADWVDEVGCYGDFEVIGSRPLDASIPGARSAKTVIDQADSSRLYYTNSNLYPIHYNFASEFLSGNGLPPVGDLSLFNQTEYYSPTRRFLLGAITHYEEPGKWTYEIAPYDSSLPEMVTQAYYHIKQTSYFGEELYFHPTSTGVEEMAASLPSFVKVITTDELFQGVTYQPLNLGEALGQLRFYSADDLGDQYVSPRDVVILDRVPNDISVVAGLITAEMQTPLSHVNVLSQNRGTPNMALRGAFDDEQLRAMDLKWVRLVVDAFEYKVEEVTKEEADAWWEEHKPDPVDVPTLDLTRTELADIETLGVDDVPAYGGKASNYGVMANIEGVPHPKAFAVPVYYYKQFEQSHGFDTRIAELQEDEQFVNDPSYRDSELEKIRDDIEAASLDADFEAAVLAKLNTDYPNQKMRFRSSTNAEDLDGFTGAGLYTSASGDPNDSTQPVADAIRKVWASLYTFRAFEERTYRGIPHEAVGMALLVHHSFPDEEANGVALTNNMFDETQPAFYINVQAGESSVVKPDPGVTVDSFLYYYYYPNQPITFFSRSNLVATGQTVLTTDQTYQLGQALDAIHQGFAQYYSKPGKFYAMDVEFKFDDLYQGGEPQLWVKQARPHYGWEGGD